MDILIDVRRLTKSTHSGVEVERVNVNDHRGQKRLYHIGTGTPNLWRAIMARLSDSVYQGEFSLHYQPEFAEQVALLTQLVDGDKAFRPVVAIEDWLREVITPSQPQHCVVLDIFDFASRFNRRVYHLRGEHPDLKQHLLKIASESPDVLFTIDSWVLERNPFLTTFAPMLLNMGFPRNPETNQLYTSPLQYVNDLLEADLKLAEILQSDNEVSESA